MPVPNALRLLSPAMVLATMSLWPARAGAIAPQEHAAVRQLDLVVAENATWGGSIRQRPRDGLRFDAWRNPLLIQGRSSLSRELERLLRSIGHGSPAVAAPQPRGTSNSSAAGDRWLDPGNVLELP